MASTRQPLGRAMARSQSSLYVCNSCRTQLSHPRITTIQQVRHASNDDLPFTEKLRRKIWGTDNPPGLADPYGGPSFLEKRAMRRKAARLAEQEQDTEQHQEQAAGENLSTQQQSPIEERYQADVDENSRAEYLEAVPVQDLPPMEEYKPAYTIKGLEEAGHKEVWGNWKATAEQSQDQYSSWFDSAVQPASNRRELLSCLHQAIVECLACKSANIQTSQVLLLNPLEVDSNVYASTKVNVSSSGALTDVEFASQREEQQFIGQLATVGTTIDEAITQPPEADTQAQTGSSQIQEVDLESIKAALDEPQPRLMEASELAADATPVKLEVSYYTVTDETFLSSKFDVQEQITFDILKRFSQLSGRRVPDPVLNSIIAGNQPKTLSHFLDRVYDTVVKPQPTSLAEILMSRQNINSIGNVMVLPRRETPVDKEKEVGRWKVIERELKDRGLPVLGKLYS